MKSDVLRANNTRDFAAHDDLLARNHAGDLATFADDNFDGLHVAFDLAVNLEQASAGCGLSLAAGRSGLSKLVFEPKREEVR